MNQFVPIASPTIRRMPGRAGSWPARTIALYRAVLRLCQSASSAFCPSGSAGSPLAMTNSSVSSDAIRSLPNTYRETLILRLVEGMTGPEIAARTGLTHGSVRVNLHRGMQQLRQVLGRKTGASDSQASSTLT